MAERDNPKAKRPDSLFGLFTVGKYAAGQSIPTIDKVPLTPEELRRRRLLRALYAGLTIATVAFAVWLGLFLKHRHQVFEAATRASDDGRVASIEGALSLLEGDDDDESTALKLRLRSMLLLAGEEESVEELRTALDALSPSTDADVLRERGIADTYVALARGDLSAALNGASRVVARGDSEAEAMRARAMAARAVGNLEQALLGAALARERRAESPRHVALFAELTDRAGDSDAARAALDELGPRANAGSRIARARIMDHAGVDIAQVAEHAQAVLDDDAATQHERAWASLLLGRAAAAAGDRLRARQHLERAGEVAPVGDELFTLALAEAALRIGANHLASQVAERLPSPMSVDAGRRAQLSAEIALAGHDLTAAEAALQHAPDDGRTSLSRARLVEARGSEGEARALYLAAAEVPALRVQATTRLAALELESGHAALAVTRAAPLLEAHPNHPDVVPVAVEAQLGLGHADVAMSLVTPALEAHPEDVRLLAAKAHVQMALDQWEAALATVEAAIAIEDDDEDLHADRGRAAWALSRLDAARESYDRALELSPSHPKALLGRLRLDLRELRVADARAILDRIDAAEMSGLIVERLRGRVLTMEIAGQSGLREVRTALGRHRYDRSLSMSLGWLYMQAEEYGHAVRTFARVMEREEVGLVEATAARSLAQIRMRASNPAEATMESLMEATDLESLPPEISALVLAVNARLAWSDGDRAGAERNARAALELDEQQSEAHLVLAETISDRNGDSTPHYEAALRGAHPSSRPFAILSIREETLTDEVCARARRYQVAAPNGQYKRGAWRVRRDCRHRE